MTVFAEPEYINCPDGEKLSDLQRYTITRVLERHILDKFPVYKTGVQVYELDSHGELFEKLGIVHRKTPEVSMRDVDGRSKSLFSEGSGPGLVMSYRSFDKLVAGMARVRVQRIKDDQGSNIWLIVS